MNLGLGSGRCHFPWSSQCALLPQEKHWGNTWSGTVAQRRLYYWCWVK